MSDLNQFSDPFAQAPIQGQNGQQNQQPNNPFGNPAQNNQSSTPGNPFEAPMPNDEDMPFPPAGAGNQQGGNQANPFSNPAQNNQQPSQQSNANGIFNQPQMQNQQPAQNNFNQPVQQPMAPQMPAFNPQTIEVPDYIAEAGGAVASNLLMVTNNATLKMIEYGSASSVDDQGNVHNYPGDPKHRLRLHVSYDAMGAHVDDEVITLTIDKNIRDNEGNIVNRELSEFMQKRTNANINYLMHQIMPEQTDTVWNFDMLASAVGRDLSQLGKPFTLYNINGHFNISPFDFIGVGGSFLEMDAITNNAFLMDPTYPSMNKVPATIVKIAYRKFKSGRHAGEPYYSLTMRIPESIAKQIQMQRQQAGMQNAEYADLITVRNIAIPGRPNASLRLPREGENPNRTLKVTFDLAAFLGTQPNVNASSPESQVASMQPNPQLNFAVGMAQASTARADGTASFFSVGYNN